MTRIIAGVARGRRIHVPPRGTRPTSERAREGLCSSLEVRFGFVGARVLDLFSGTGALGLEASSRGAQSVVMVELNKQAADIIKKNAALVGTDGLSVVNQKASTYLSVAPRQFFSMVLADPPYELSDEAVNDMVRAIVPTLVDGAVVVVERHRDSPEVDWPACMVKTPQKLKKRIFGIARMDMAVFDAELLKNEPEDTQADTAPGSVQ